MVRFAELLKPCLGLLLLSLSCANAFSTTLVADTSGQWNLFDVDVAQALDVGAHWIDAVSNPDAGFSGDGSSLHYLINNTQPQYLTVVDGGLSGERYWLNLDGATVYTSTAIDNGHYQGLDFAAALADPSFSRGTWLVQPGMHFLTGGLYANGGNINASVGAFQLTDVPLPPGISLLSISFGIWLFALLRRRATASASVALLAALAPALHCQAVEPTGTWIKLVAFNDFHGQLESPGTFRANAAATTPTLAIGGIDWMAGYVAHLKAQNPRTLVVSAGDIIGATPLISALFHDEPTIEAMNRLGLDFNAVGNHEFDEGRDELLRMQQGGCHPTDVNSCKGARVGTPVPFEGAKFKFLAANVKDHLNPFGQRPLFPPYAVKQWGSLRVALIGLTLKDTPSIVTPSGVFGLHFEDEANTVNSLVPILRARGVNAIVVLLHQGGTQPVPQAADTINSCVGNLADTPILPIVGALDDAVDLVITGHTHQAYNCLLPNRVGRNIPVTSANAQGRVLSDINLLLDKNGEVLTVNAHNIVVDRSRTDIAPNGNLQALVASYKNLSTPIANRVIGEITAAMNNNSTNTAGEIALGDVLADAQLAVTKGSEVGAAQVAFMNPGGIRSPGFNFIGSSAGEGDGKVTYGEAFTVQPFGNTLVTLSVTGEQLRIMLEQQFTGCNAATAPASFNYPIGDTGQSFDRVLQVSAGFNYRWNPAGSVCQKVDTASITLAGQPVLPDNWYRITVNNFLADGGDKFYILPKGQYRLGGAQDIDALEAWFNNPAADADPSKPGVQIAPGPQNRILLTP